ncbi:hypothetical protein ERX46_07410 [Brumimicrobium glaciale]|uniref:Carboxypeptidase regulatory-like domain-containing protein n=1 Tax=Brumimicrobium glaciale TaxID=200475 RepID=A0A4Q4KL90_9FLAO|nr:hypothetical protein [Brumimicrobium glaciale]RYM33788.1 hypothetical protein ERX46_07410 [Brumimicrobium glaciale]
MNLRKKLILKICFSAAVLFLFISCECSRSANGKVLDEETLLPIDSVLVKALTVLYGEVLSDSTGNYFLGSEMTGAVGGCPDLEVSYSKKGYQSRIVVNPDKSVIYLKKE